MAVSHNFRSALNGFNREDVVRYIEYLNTKQTTQVNQLTSENEDLRKKLEALEATPEPTKDIEKLAALEAERDELKTIAELAEAERDAALSEVATLKAQLAEQAGRNLATQELEAYRRAERAERAAKERADQIYQQATGTLAQATAQVDNAAEQFRQVTERINLQMGQLQAAVEMSKSALVDAATTMYSIRPECPEE